MNKKKNIMLRHRIDITSQLDPVVFAIDNEQLRNDLNDVIYKTLRKYYPQMVAGEFVTSLGMISARTVICNNQEIEKTQSIASVYDLI